MLVRGEVLTTTAVMGFQRLWRVFCFHSKKSKCILHPWDSHGAGMGVLDNMSLVIILAFLKCFKFKQA
jgi:hypothetical protein